MNSRRRLSACVVVLGLIAVGCSGSNDEAAPTTTVAAPDSDDGTTGSAGPVDAADAPGGEPAPDPTPIPLDPAVRAGVLDNGLTYYAMSNDSPGAKLELRLVVNAGSLHQEVPDAGSAHFLEHMLFNGTTQFPGLALDDALRGFGMAIGPDVNAYTWFDETVYELSLPTTPEAIETGFDIVREWMTNATIDEQAVTDERGVVREELRVRDESADGVINDVVFSAYIADSPYVGREVSGSVERALATTPDGLRAFYDRWYRPEHMAVIAVGDLPVDDLEQLIADEFSSVEPRTDEQVTQPDRGVGDLDDIVVDVVTHPDGPEPRVSLDYALPHWDADTVGGERLRLIEDLANQMLSIDLDNAATRGTIDAIGPGGGTFGFVRERRFLGFNFAGDDPTASTEDVVGLIASTTANGFPRSTFDRAVAGARSGVEQELAGLGSRQDTRIASALVSVFLDGAAFDAVDASVARRLALLDELTVEDVNQHLQYVMSRSAPILVAFGNDPADFDLAALSAAVAAGLDADRVLDSAADSDVQPGQELMAAPDRVQAVSNDDVDIDGVDATELTLANGVRVFITESEISEGEVFLLAAGEGGFSVLEPGLGQPITLAAGAASRSGIGEYDAIDLQTALADRNVGLTPFISLLQEGFQGSADADDLETLFQLLHLSITSARIDDAAWREAVDGADQAATFYETDPSGAGFVALIDARYGDTGYHALAPDVDAIASLGADGALDLFQQRFSAIDDFTVAIVGDVPTEVVVELAERYLSGLPMRPEDPWVDRSGPPPDGVVAVDVCRCRRSGRWLRCALDLSRRRRRCGTGGDDHPPDGHQRTLLRDDPRGTRRVLQRRRRVHQRSRSRRAGNRTRHQRRRRPVASRRGACAHARRAVLHRARRHLRRRLRGSSRDCLQRPELRLERRSVDRAPRHRRRR